MPTKIIDGIEYVVVDMTWDADSADAMKRDVWRSGSNVEEFKDYLGLDDDATYDDIRTAVLSAMTWPSWYVAPQPLVRELIELDIITQAEYDDSIEALHRKRA
jgi:hypothetical protein